MPVTAAETPKGSNPPKLADPDGTDEEPITITGVHGTVARFEMSYEAERGERVRFGPPLRMRWPSLVYLAIALAIAGVVVWGYNAPSTSRIFRWVVEGDRTRPLGSQVLAVIVVVSALATVIRAHMRGVVVGADWIEARHLLPMGIPRALRWGWPQVHRVIVDREKATTALELMDGSFERLPEVADPAALQKLLVGYALKRNIEVTELTTAKRAKKIESK
jgi:hypothetical protein